MKKLIYVILFSMTTLGSSAQTNINWSETISVAEYAFGNDYPRIVLDGDDKPIITWGNNKKIYLSRLKGNDFSSPLQLNNDTTDAYTAFWTGTDLACRNDTIYACFMHNNWGKKSYIVSSFDNGESFGNPNLIENYADNTSRFPTVAITATGQPIVGIMKMDSNGHHPHFVIRNSTDYGESFTSEINVGAWSGPASEACDCCPGSIRVKDNKVAIFYRDNLHNIRDIWTTVSTDYGQSFSSGFSVDDSNWEAFICPSSGPDGVIIGDSLYTVFHSDGLAYLSRSSISSQTMTSKTLLGEIPITGTQNLPRIEQHGNAVAIVWKSNALGTNLLLWYTSDITNGKPFLQETITTQQFATADVTISANAIHVVWEDYLSGTVKYRVGTLGTTAIKEIESPDFTIYPNPTTDFLTIQTKHLYQSIQLFNSKGQLHRQGAYSKTIDVSELEAGYYILELISSNQQSSQGVFIKE